MRNKQTSRDLFDALKQRDAARSATRKAEHDSFIDAVQVQQLVVLQKISKQLSDAPAPAPQPVIYEEKPVILRNITPPTRKVKHVMDWLEANPDRADLPYRTIADAITAEGFKVSHNTVKNAVHYNQEGGDT